jgi:hypothetical protein
MFCQVPAFNLARMERLMANTSRPNIRLSDGFSDVQFFSYPVIKNMSHEDFMEAVAAPLWTTLRSCRVWYNRDEDDDSACNAGNGVVSNWH